MLSKAEQLKRHAPLKQKPFKSKEYMEWIHEKPCIVCNTLPVEAHHVKNGIGQRDDRSCIPLCMMHHRGTFSPHGYDSNLFYQAYPKDKLLEMAQKLYDEYKGE
jgi:hypothetical protein